ncbi:MAG: helix-turn-helix domain-containing protein, partial [Bacteroidota bacterium]
MRSDCTISYALDFFGDKWTLLIIRDMAMEQKRFYKEFLGSKEGIATNILSSRLKMLEELHLISKEKLPHNKKTNIYRL